METVLYADVLFLINFAMDFISLSASASLGALSKRPLRLCAASALGAVYGVVATASGASGPLLYIPAVLVGGAMCVISFGFNGIKPLLRQCFVFFGCGALLGGIMTMLLTCSASPGKALIIPTAISGVFVLILTVRAICSRVGCKEMKIDLVYKGKSLSVHALCDSGNLLRDPFSGRPVVIISEGKLSQLIPKEDVSALISCNVDRLEDSRIMPYFIPRGSDAEKGLLCAIRPDSASVSAGGRRAQRDILLAPRKTPEGYYGGFSATAPSVLIP